MKQINLPKTASEYLFQQSSLHKSYITEQDAHF